MMMRTLTNLLYFSTILSICICKEQIQHLRRSDPTTKQYSSRDTKTKNRKLIRGQHKQNNIRRLPKADVKRSKVNDSEEKPSLINNNVNNKSGKTLEFITGKINEALDVIPEDVVSTTSFLEEEIHDDQAEQIEQTNLFPDIHILSTSVDALSSSPKIPILSSSIDALSSSPKVPILSTSIDALSSSPETSILSSSLDTISSLTSNQDQTKEEDDVGCKRMKKGKKRKLKKNKKGKSQSPKGISKSKKGNSEDKFEGELISSSPHSGASKVVNEKNDKDDDYEYDYKSDQDDDTEEDAKAKDADDDDDYEYDYKSDQDDDTEEDAKAKDADDDDDYEYDYKSDQDDDTEEDAKAKDADDDDDYEYDYKSDQDDENESDYEYIYEQVGPGCSSPSNNIVDIGDLQQISSLLNNNNEEGKEEEGTSSNNKNGTISSLLAIPTSIPPLSTILDGINLPGQQEQEQHEETSVISVDNVGPRAVDDIFETIENTPVTLNILENDLDALTVESYTQPENGSLLQDSDESLIYLPKENWVGVDSFTYTIGANEEESATVNIIVKEEPESDTSEAVELIITPPTTGTDNEEDITIFFTLSDGESGLTIDERDIVRNHSNEKQESPSLHYYVKECQQPHNGDIFQQRTRTSNAYTYIQNVGFHGVDTFECDICAVSDDSDLEDTEKECPTSTSITIQITVEYTNIPPFAMDDTYYVTKENYPLVLSTKEMLLNDYDPDGSELSIKGCDQPQNGDLGALSEEYFLYTPPTDFIGLESFECTVCDEMMDCDISNVVIMVGDLNNNGGETTTTTTTTINTRAMNDQFYVMEDTEQVLDVLTNDEVIFTTSRSSSSDGDSSERDMDLVIVNYTFPLNGNLQLVPTGNRVNDKPVFVYKPLNNFHGVDFFEYTIDITNATRTTTTSATSTTRSKAIVAIVVTPTNDIPIAVNDTFLTTEDSVLQMNVLGNDVDVDSSSSALVIVNYTNPKHGTLMGISSTSSLSSINRRQDRDSIITSLSYIPDKDYYGMDSFQYRISDGEGSVSENYATVTIMVEMPYREEEQDEVHDMTAVDDHYVTLVNKPLIIVSSPEESESTTGILENDVCTSDSSLIITEYTHPSNGVLTLNVTSGEFMYTPNFWFDGVDAFEYTIGSSDEAVSSSSSTAVVYIEVRVPDVPFKKVQEQTQADQQKESVNSTSSD